MYFHLVFESLTWSTKSPEQKQLPQDTLYHKDSSCPFRANVHFSYPASLSYKRNYITAWISSQALWLDTFKDVIGYAFFRFTGRSKLHYLLPCNDVCAPSLSLALSLKQNLHWVKNNYPASKKFLLFWNTMIYNREHKTPTILSHFTACSKTKCSNTPCTSTYPLHCLFQLASPHKTLHAHLPLTWFTTPPTSLHLYLACHKKL